MGSMDRTSVKDDANQVAHDDAERQARARLALEARLDAANKNLAGVADERPHASMSDYMVDRQRSGGETLTRYPNGVKTDRRADGTVGYVPPPGGHVGADNNGQTAIFDSKGKEVAWLDKDKAFHIKTSHGEYLEKANGKVSFTSSDSTTDFKALHKSGVVDPKKFEDYGISSDGKVIRFPNGIEYNKGKHQVIVPAEYPNFREVDGVGYDQNNKRLYRRDKNGVLHVPAKDGEFTVGADSRVKFQSNDSTSGKLPDVQITGDKNDNSCNKYDPLCGLDGKLLDTRDPWEKKKK